MVRFKFSRCLCLQTPDVGQAVDFYRSVLGLPLVERQISTAELKAGENRLFIDQGEATGPIMEFLVNELDEARDVLLASGCTVIRWEGKGGCCYIKDPFGFIFNLYEDPDAFETGESA